MLDKLDICAVRKHLLPALRTTVHTTMKKALDELEVLRVEAKHSEDLARYYHNKLLQRDDRIAQLKKEKNKVDARIVCLEKKIPPPVFRCVPRHWPPSYNANSSPCDMIDGPCACGGWHSPDEPWVQDRLAEFGVNG